MLLFIFLKMQSFPVFESNWATRRLKNCACKQLIGRLSSHIHQLNSSARPGGAHAISAVVGSNDPFLWIYPIHWRVRQQYLKTIPKPMRGAMLSPNAISKCAPFIPSFTNMYRYRCVMRYIFCDRIQNLSFCKTPLTLPRNFCELAARAENMTKYKLDFATLS